MCSKYSAGADSEVGKELALPCEACFLLRRLHPTHTYTHTHTKQTELGNLGKETSESYGDECCEEHTQCQEEEQ